MAEATNVPTRDLGTLFGLLQEAKAMESLANDERLAVEAEILRHIDNAPSIGSLTLKAGSMRCSVKFSLTHKADVGGIRSLDVPAEVLPLKLVPSSFKFDPKAYEALRNEHPDVFMKVAAHVATKPSKPGLTLKL